MVKFPSSIQAKKVTVSPPPAPEDKRAKFVRLANSRVSAALHSMKLIRNLANRAIYDYTDQDVTRIRNTLALAITAIVDRFEKHDRAEWVFDVESEDIVAKEE